MKVTRSISLILCFAFVSIASAKEVGPKRKKQGNRVVSSEKSDDLPGPINGLWKVFSYVCGDKNISKGFFSSENSVVYSFLDSEVSLKLNDGNKEEVYFFRASYSKSHVFLHSSGNPACLRLSDFSSCTASAVSLAPASGVHFSLSENTIILKIVNDPVCGAFGGSPIDTSIVQANKI